MSDRYPLVEDGTTGTYEVYVKWAGGKTYEVEAESETEAINRACEEAENGLDMGDGCDISSTSIEDFAPVSDPVDGAHTADQWAGIMVDELRTSGMRRTPISGPGVAEAIGPDGMPREIVRALGRIPGASIAKDDEGTTYLCLTPGGA